MMQGTKLINDDWQRLRRLRQRFLENVSENYWSDNRELELYNLTYAERIGWKWNAVLKSLDDLGWKPLSEQIVDWGCGTGIASRTVLEWSNIKKSELFDQSPLAMAFAKAKLLQKGIEATSYISTKPLKGTLFLISHVVSELSEAELHKLATMAATADEIIWVEPGSHELSRKLGSLRNIFIDAGHQLIAPCVHEQSCPMFEQKQERHWCHFFASPPTEIFQSAFWHEASRELGIDLRSLPYSYLVFSRHPQPPRLADKERLIGHPRALKAHGKLLCCGTAGLCERIVQKRDNPALFKKLIKNKEDGLFSWSLNHAERIVGAEQYSKKVADYQP